MEYIMVFRSWFFFYVAHNPVAGSHKGVDFTYQFMRYHPRFIAVDERDEDGHTGGVE